MLMMLQLVMRVPRRDIPYIRNGGQMLQFSIPTAASRLCSHRATKRAALLSKFEPLQISPVYETLTHDFYDMKSGLSSEHEFMEQIYEVCKLSNETGNVAPDLATLRRRDLQGGSVGFQKVTKRFDAPNEDGVVEAPCAGKGVQVLVKGGGIYSFPAVGRLVDSERLESKDSCFREPLLSVLVEPAIEKTLEQRYAIKFCVKLKKTPLETFGMLREAFGDDCLSRSRSNRWHKMFREGREEVTHEARSGRPSISRMEKQMTRVLQLLNSDRRTSCLGTSLGPFGINSMGQY
ncbi:hypothetical protein NQ318_006195 [Aromia moschata]|uniref:Mos1 transposase HTH domain-containing protein n=1 Tax=Aromia moschata TaxID=1265417 RepID=A0AAV8YFM9_9CUCU|nr:hypothetical protein NQ318_006195 [Aromia moschata]